MRAPAVLNPKRDAVLASFHDTHGCIAMASLSAVVVATAALGRQRVGEALDAVGFHHSLATVANAEGEVARHRPDLVVVAKAADSVVEVECLHQLRSRFPHPKYLFVTEVSNEDLAIAALHAGAQRYLKEPWTDAMMKAAVTALLPLGALEGQVADGLVGGERLVGRSASLTHLRTQLARMAAAASHVLIVGETGTGKELVAELLHLNGARRSKPFICVNTAAIPDALLENELFGHERGAFTGAITSQPGKLAAAHGGTLFLDEIGDVSLAIQAKLLRAIESKCIYPLGATRSVQLDVRIVAATNGDLERAVAEGRCRKDLYYRLN